MEVEIGLFIVHVIEGIVLFVVVCLVYVFFDGMWKTRR